MDIVSALRTALADKVGHERFELWFGASTRLALGEGGLAIHVPSRFFLDWIRANFRSQIEDACRLTLGTCPNIEFSIDATLAEVNNASDANSPAISDAPSKPVLAKVSSDESSPGSISAAAPYRPRMADLDSFAAGHCNRLALASAEMAVRRPGHMSPLVIYGPTGVGKDASAARHYLRHSQAPSHGPGDLSFGRAVHHGFPRSVAWQRTAQLPPQVPGRGTVGHR